MTKQQFEELQKQLEDHHINCIGNAFTRAPLFLVQVKKEDWGYQQDYSEGSALFYPDCEGNYFETVDEFLEYYDADEWEYMFDGHSYEDKQLFVDNHEDLEDIATTMSSVDDSGCWEVLHCNTRWETINYFLTRDAAQNFIDCKAGRENKNARIYVDSLYRSNQFEFLLDAIARGKLVFKEEGDE